MKIGLLGPVCWRTPPTHYGRWNRSSAISRRVWWRAASMSPSLPAAISRAGTLDAICPGSIDEHPDLDGKVYEYMHIAHCYERARDFDLIHNNYDDMGHVWARLVPRRW